MRFVNAKTSELFSHPPSQTPFLCFTFWNPLMVHSCQVKVWKWWVTLPQVSIFWRKKYLKNFTAISLFSYDYELKYNFALTLLWRLHINNRHTIYLLCFRYWMLYISFLINPQIKEKILQMRKQNWKRVLEACPNPHSKQMVEPALKARSVWY